MVDLNRKMIFNQLIGLREKLQENPENPVFHGNIYGFLQIFPFLSTHWSKFWWIFPPSGGRLLPGPFRQARADATCGWYAPQGPARPGDTGDQVDFGWPALICTGVPQKKIEDAKIPRKMLINDGKTWKNEVKTYFKNLWGFWDYIRCWITPLL